MIFSNKIFEYRGDKQVKGWWKQILTKDKPCLMLFLFILTFTFNLQAKKSMEGKKVRKRDLEEINNIQMIHGINM